MTVSRSNGDSQGPNWAAPSIRTAVPTPAAETKREGALVGPGQLPNSPQNRLPFVRTVSPVNVTRDFSNVEASAPALPGLSGVASMTPVSTIVPGNSPELQSHIGSYLRQNYPQSGATKATSQSGGDVYGQGTATEGQEGLATVTDWGVANSSLGTNESALPMAQSASAEPEMDTANGSVRYAQVLDPSQETLFGTTGPVHDDVQQRDDGAETDGDCPVMAAMSALADQDPGAVQNMVQQTGSHTYDVTLYYEGKPETYAVDDSFPVDAQGKPTGAQLTIDPDSGKAVLWPSLVEKAYAKLQDVHPGLLPWSGVAGYQDLNQGGTGADALATLTGKKVYQTDPRGAGDEEVSGLLNLSNQGVPVTVMTGLTNSGTLPSGLQPNHIYSVVSTYQDSSGQHMALLRNPWGEDPNQDSADEPGLISVPFSSIESDCRGINAGDVIDNNDS